MSAQAFVEHMQQYDRAGTPWLPSKYDRKLTELYKLASEHKKATRTPTPGVTYVLLDGLGVGYDYFTRGAVAEFGTCPDEHTIHVEAIVGGTFKVTQDASFGNTPAQWAVGQRVSKGIANSGYIYCVSTEDALELLNMSS